MKTRLAPFALSLAVAAAALAEPLPTRVTVRAVSRDAKILGSNVGGARITIKDAASGKVLATGLQEGSTGDTKKIMVEPRRRGGSVYDTDGAAAYVATLMLERPLQVEIAAEGPLNHPRAMQRVSKTMTLVPGRHIEGDGVVLEIHGYNIELLAPAAEVAAGDVPLRMKMTMTCGCPLEPGGMWDSDGIEIVARLFRGAQRVAETPVRYAGTTSMFAATLPDVTPGEYELEITAADPANANFAVYRETFVAR